MRIILKAYNKITQDAASQPQNKSRALWVIPGLTTIKRKGLSDSDKMLGVMRRGHLDSALDPSLVTWTSSVKSLLRSRVTGWDVLSELIGACGLAKWELERFCCAYCYFYSSACALDALQVSTKRRSLPQSDCTLTKCSLLSVSLQWQ